MNLLKAQEAAKRLGIGLTKFWELVALYKVPKIQLTERCLRFDPRDLEQLIESRRVSCPTDDRRMADGRRAS